MRLSLLSKIVARFGRKSSDSVGLELREVWNSWGLSQAGVAVNTISAMQHVAVMACVSVLSEDVAKLPIRVMREVGKTRLEVKDHWLTKLLRRPNSWQTRFEFMEMMQAALVLRGNAYAPILRNWRGEPTALIPVHPDHVALYEAPDGGVFYMVSRSGQHERAVLQDMPLMIPAEDMFHLRGLSLQNSLQGAARVHMMREAIGLGMSQEIQSAKLAGSGARPGGVLQTDGTLTKEVIERLKADWQSSYGGVQNSGKTAILEQGLKWEPLGMTMVDAEWLESRRFQLEDICRGFRVPRHKVGMPAEGGANLSQLEQEYVNSVLSSYCARWAARMELDFDLDEEGVTVEFDYSDLGKADIATRLNTARVGVIGMIYTPNEARAMAGGLPPVEGGDTLYQPTNMAPIGFEPVAGGAGPGSDTSGAPAAGGDGDPAKLPSL